MPVALPGDARRGLDGQGGRGLRRGVGGRGAADRGGGVDVAGGVEGEEEFLLEHDVVALREGRLAIIEVGVPAARVAAAAWEHSIDVNLVTHLQRHEQRDHERGGRAIHVHFHHEGVLDAPIGRLLDAPDQTQKVPRDEHHGGVGVQPPELHVRVLRGVGPQHEGGDVEPPPRHVRAALPRAQQHVHPLLAQHLVRGPLAHVRRVAVRARGVVHSEHSPIAVDLHP
mmetsp:Transcript_29337/g.93906  ORF Transcript_29337/g.93906 Transcript_29337/m.93906 type:complete len:226 (-) Transcript_29337:869-1546(-)